MRSAKVRLRGVAAAGPSRQRRHRSLRLGSLRVRIGRIMVTDSTQVCPIEQVLNRWLALRELLQGAQQVIRNAAVLTR